MLLVALFGFVAYVALFYSWKAERRRVALLRQKSDDDRQKQMSAVSGQRRRFRDSSVFSYAWSSLCSTDGSTDKHSSFCRVASLQAFSDTFDSFADVTAAMRAVGLGACNFIVAVDFTASNEWQGRRTFNRQCLHSLDKTRLNPYQQVIVSLGRTLEPLNDAGCVHAVGFGCRQTKDSAVFPFNDDFAPCSSFMHVLDRYTALASGVQLSGPTSFAPVLREAISVLRIASHSYHILIIISDGQMGDDSDTVDAIVEASLYPLSIVLVGVGDGPWATMEEYDDQLPRRRFDNFQFVDYRRAVATARGNERAQTVFALHALMEIPDQYKAVRHLGYI